jgi:hypothetical protein
MGYLTMKHLNGMQISSGCLMDYLIVVVEVATTQFEEEKAKESQSSMQLRLIKKEVLKKPMPMHVDSPRKQGFDEEKIIVSTLESQRRKNSLKRIYGSGEWEIDLNINQKKSKYNSKKLTTSMRLEKKKKLDVPSFQTHHQTCLRKSRII